MKRKEKGVSETGQPGAVAEAEAKSMTDGASGGDPSRRETPSPGGDFFFMEDGVLKPFSSDEYTTSTLYQAIESFSVERRYVRPEDPGSIVFEGKKPSKKTLPIVVNGKGDYAILSSWEDLEAKPEQLAEAKEVIGASPVKQVFILRKK